MNTQLSFTTKDFENLVWKDHDIFESTKAAKVFFPNGYGVSILTSQNEAATGLLSSFFKPYGSQKEATYEVGVLRGVESEHEFVNLPQVADLDGEDGVIYERFGGIWCKLKLDKLLQKVSLVTTL